MIKVSGIDGIALTKLDVLDGFPEIKVCVGYELDGQRINSLPAGTNAQARVKPIYESFEGWSQSTRGARTLGAAAGAGGEIRAPHRGADRVPGDAALHQPRARRHHPGEGPVRGLTRLACVARPLKPRAELVEARNRALTAVSTGSDGGLRQRDDPRRRGRSRSASAPAASSTASSRSGSTGPGSSDLAVREARKPSLA